MPEAITPPVQGQPKPGESQPEQVLNTFLTDFETWTKDPKPEGVEALKGHVTKYREAAEAAKKAAEAGKPVVPEKYELKLPEKSLLDQGYLQRMGETAKKAGWTQDQVNERIKEHHELIGLVQQADAAKLKKLDEEWVNILKSDPEFGGDKFAVNSEKAKKFWEAVADEDLRKAIESMGVLNYPALVKAFAKAHDTFGVGEDGGVRGNHGKPAPQSIADRIGAYPESKNVAVPT